jgi:Tfp pilus assembly protein PilF
MKSRLYIPLALLSATLGACVHTPPGTSVNVALARKADLVRLPGPLPASVAVTNNQPIVEPALPENGKLEKVAEAFSRGQFCMQVDKDNEAISAFEEAVKLDPGFSDAWQNLAVLYEKIGDEKKALEAFRRFKKIAQQ